MVIKVRVYSYFFVSFTVLLSNHCVWKYTCSLHVNSFLGISLKSLSIGKTSLVYEG